MIMLAVVAAALVTAGTTTAAGTRTVKIGDNWFVAKSSEGDSPGRTVTVTKGATVKWTWTGEEDHNIRASKVPSGESKTRFKIKERSSGSVSRKMTVAGTYRLYCSIHDYVPQKMVLKVVNP
jgi:plastocyanin